MLKTQAAYDDRDLLQTLETHTFGGALVSGFSYTRDPDGNLQTQTMAHLGTTVTYAHDGLSRLTSESWSGAIAYQGAYGYDLNGNRNSKVIQQGGSTLTTTCLFDDENRLYHAETTTPAASVAFSMKSTTFRPWA